MIFYFRKQDFMIFIDEFKEGDVISGIYLCKSKQASTTKTGKEYENVVLMDKTGSIDSKIWEPTSPGIRDFDANDFVMVKGQVTSYNRALQFKIDSARKAEPGEYIESDYMPVSRFGADELFKELYGLIDSVKNKYLNRLLTMIFKEDKVFAERFKTATAAKSVHHGFVSGLLEHTVSVARLCTKICDNYDYVNHDLLVTGAMLHDIGKVREIAPFPQNDYTDEGNMIGHLVIGYGMVREKIALIEGFPGSLANQVEHMILSHHGELEFGSPKKPATIEALALAAADNLDAHLETMRELMEVKNPNTWLGFNKWLDTNIRRTEI